MGRGRAKAKQQKVARELKYNSQSTDLDALQRELGGTHDGAHNGSSSVTDLDSDDDDEADDSDDYETDQWTGTSR